MDHTVKISYGQDTVWSILLRRLGSIMNSVALPPAGLTGIGPWATRDNDVEIFCRREWVVFETASRLLESVSLTRLRESCFPPLF